MDEYIADPANTRLERRRLRRAAQQARYPAYGHGEPAGPGRAERTHRLAGSLQTR
jgi:hypothetical protein